jgi:hypothetical protein
MVPFAETYGDCAATLCPFSAKKHEAENILKTKDWEGRFSENEAENMLKISPLSKTVGTQNLDDKLSDDVGGATRRPPESGRRVGTLCRLTIVRRENSPELSDFRA